MKNINKLLLPMVTSITIVCGSMIPLVSCNWKISDKDKPDPEPEPTCPDLCFSAIKGKGESTVSYETYISPLKGSMQPTKIENIDIQYSRDGKTWYPWEIDETTWQSDPIILNSDDTDETNDKLYVKNIDPNNTLSYLHDYDTYNFSFQNTGKVKVSGNILSMINYSNVLTNEVFSRLFFPLSNDEQNTGLVSCKDLIFPRNL